MSSLPISLNHPRNRDDSKSAASKLAPGDIFRFLHCVATLPARGTPRAPAFYKQPSTWLETEARDGCVFPTKKRVPWVACHGVEDAG